jgi:hypothetical protein
MTRQLGDLTCADCGADMWMARGTLPQGQARCRPCRRANPQRAKSVRCGASCPVCQEPMAAGATGARPCRKCDHIGSRKPRECEACGKEYKPTHSLQRACGRACGRWFHAATVLVCAVEWSTCLVCLDPYMLRHEQRHGTCSAACRNEAAKVMTPRRPEPEWRLRIYECPMCGENFSNPYTTRVVHCSTRCSRKATKQRRRVREAGTFGEWRWSDFMRMAAKFNYCCAYCGEKPDRLDPDHVVPLSRGGPNVLANLLPTCLQCNADKNARTLSEWEAWRHERGKPPRRTSWAPEDSRYWHLTYGNPNTAAA